MNRVDEVIERFIDFYSAIDMRSPKVLDELYDSNIVFRDPFGDHYGIKELKKVLSPLILSINFYYILTDVPVSNKKSFTIQWTLYWSHPLLTHKEISELNKCTFAYVDNAKIVLQQNYYDLGKLLYEKIPLLNIAIQKIKRERIREEQNGTSDASSPG